MTQEDRGKIVIAKWESKETWDRLHKQYKPTEYDIEGVKGLSLIHI